jgi:hypothetical protein
LLQLSTHWLSLAITGCILVLTASTATNSLSELSLYNFSMDNTENIASNNVANCYQSQCSVMGRVSSCVYPAIA